MKQKVIAISQERGIFLGTVSGFAVFSKTDPVGIAKAYGFDSVDDAESYFLNVLPQVANNMFYPTIQSPTDYVSCVDIIKQGYERYTFNMIDHLEMPSRTIH